MERANRDIKTLFRASFSQANFARMRNVVMYTMNSYSPILYNSKKYTNKKIGKAREPYHKN